MLKYKKTLWLAILLLGALAVTAFLVLLAVNAEKGGLTVISLVVLLLGVVGGGWLVFTAARTLPHLSGTDAEITGNKREREQALAALAANRASVSRRFSSCLTVVVLILSAAVFLFAYGEARQVESIPQSTVEQGTVYAKAKVLSVDELDFRNIQEFEGVAVGSQTVTVEVVRGTHKGEQYQLINNLSYLYGTVLEVGDPITMTFIDGKAEPYVQDYDRTTPLIFVVLFFLLVTVLVGGKVGAKSLLGLGLTILCIFTVLLPLLLDGAPTLPTVLGVCAFVTVVEFVILGGVNRKTICAILGTISGVVFAALFGKLACAMLKVGGYRMYEADSSIEALLQIKQGQDPLSSLQIGDLLVGGILVAALGAVNDVAMSISSAMNELITVNPNLTRRALLKSGMNIGRDMVGTMTNTLILALVGSGFVTILYLYSLEPSFQQLMSTAYFSVEIVQAIASSVGVILAVPLSVVIGMVLFGKPHSKEK